MIYAIGDIHGQLDSLRRAHELILADKFAHDGDSAAVVHVGDLVDRGPDSKGVIDYLMEGRRKREDWVILRGNHDQLFLNFINGGDGTDPHLRKGMTWQSAVVGGASTLASYGVKKRRLEGFEKFAARGRKAISPKHGAFLDGLPIWFETDDILFVHAGIRPGFPLEAQDEDDLMWIRDEFLWHMAPHKKLIVHGHTPVEEPTHYGNRINIDCGAGWGNDIVPVVIDGDKCFALTENGRVPVKAPSEYYQ